MDLKIVEAKKADRNFIIFSNKAIDEASYIETSKLDKNVDNDIFKSKKAICLIAKDKDKNIGMILFSKVYWADRGEGIYISQAYVLPEYRKKGIFKKLLKASYEYYKKTQFVTCLVARKNVKMVDCMHNLSFEDEDMLSYVKNKDDFLNSLQKNAKNISQ